MKKTIQVPSELTRAATITEEVIGDKRSKRVSISSDEPYLRYDWFADEEYWEVLGHGPGDIDDSRLKLGLPVLFNHRRDDHLGRATKHHNDGHKLDVGTLDDIIWSGSDFAKTKKADVESGALVGTSVGYEIIDDGVCIGQKDGKPIYKFRWAPHEFSFCTIEADTTVGAGRQRDNSQKPELREISVAVENQIDSETNPGQTRAMPDTVIPPAVDVEAERKAAREEFKAKCKKINDHVAAIKSDKWKELVRPIAAKHLDGEANFEDFRTEANNAIDAYTSSRMEGEGDHEGRIEVVGERGGNPRQALSIGAQFINSQSFKDNARRTGHRRSISMDCDIPLIGMRGKAMHMQRAGFVSSDLSAVNVAPMQNLIALGVQRLTVMDLIAPGATSAAAIPYPRENSLGTVDGVAPTAPAMARAKTVGERELKPNWDPDLTTETANVKKVAITTKVPDEFMADFPGMRSYIDQRMPYMVDIETEFQVLYGDGLGNNLEGIFSTPGIQTRAITTTSDATVAASLKQGITDIQVNAQFEPDGYVFHPYDWETASLLKDTNGRFLAGGPFYVPYTNGVFMEMYTFWGKPVVITTSATYGKPLVGCWKLGAQYFIREGMRLETTNANEDDFRRNLIAIRAEHRLALATYRPVAFLEFTGFPARA